MTMSVTASVQWVVGVSVAAVLLVWETVSGGLGLGSELIREQNIAA